MDRLAEALEPDEARDALRLIAGILIAVGLLLVSLRRGAFSVFGETSSEFAIFVVLAAPAAFLFVIGLLGAYLNAEPRGWQAAYTVTGVLLIPPALFQLAEVVDPGAEPAVVIMLVFAVGAAAAITAWRLAEVRFQLLLGAIYLLIGSAALFDNVLDGGILEHLRGFRIALLVFASQLLVASLGVRAEAVEEPERAQSELITGAGIAALVAVLVALPSQIGLGPLSLAPVVLDLPEPSILWDALTLLIGLGLVLYGATVGFRGPVYVGGAILAVFLLSVGLDLDDPTPEGAIVGWPLIVVLAGLALFLLSGRELGLGDRLEQLRERLEQ